MVIYDPTAGYVWVRFDRVSPLQKAKWVCKNGDTVMVECDYTYLVEVPAERVFLIAECQESEPGL